MKIQLKSIKNKIIPFYIAIFTLLYVCISTIRFFIKEVLLNEKYVWCVIYQGLLILIAYLFYDNIITKYAYHSHSVFFRTILIFFEIVAIFFVNATIEFLFRMFKKEDFFKTILEVQKILHNYIFSIISLLAIYVAYHTSNGTLTNQTLFILGVWIFLCTITTDLYSALFFKRDIVKQIYDKFINA